MEDSDKTNEKKPQIKDLIEKLKEIHSGFEQNLANLHQKIELFELKPELSNNIENFKKTAESRANDLEEEVKQLREQLEAVRDLLGLER